LSFYSKVTALQKALEQVSHCSKSRRLKIKYYYFVLFTMCDVVGTSGFFEVFF
jgi:hypothetical protein